MPHPVALPGTIAKWKHLASLGDFATNITSFIQFEERIFLVTHDDRVYAFGNQTINNKRLQYALLGLGKEAIDVTSPTEVVELRGQKVVKFCKGARHVMALTKDGHLWAWGKNDLGQLGIGSKHEHYRPVLVTRAQHVIDIECTEMSSFALTKEHRVLAWGGNALGQLATGDRKLRLEPFHVHLENVVTLSATYYNMLVAITNNSEAYFWGNKAVTKPKLMQLPKVPVSVVATNLYYYMLSEDGHIYKNTVHKKDVVELHYHGDIRFKSIYIFRNIDYLVGVSTDDKIYICIDGCDESIKLQHVDNVAEVFSHFSNYLYLPFMITVNETKTVY